MPRNGKKEAGFYWGNGVIILTVSSLRLVVSRIFSIGTEIIEVIAITTNKIEFSPFDTTTCSAWQRYFRCTPAARTNRLCCPY